MRQNERPETRTATVRLTLSTWRRFRKFAVEMEESQNDLLTRGIVWLMDGMEEYGKGAEPLWLPDYLRERLESAAAAHQVPAETLLEDWARKHGDPLKEDSEPLWEPEEETLERIGKAVRVSKEDPRDFVQYAVDVALDKFDEEELGIAPRPAVVPGTGKGKPIDWRDLRVSDGALGGRPRPPVQQRSRAARRSRSC